MQFAQPEYMDTFFQYIFGFFDRLFSTPLQPWIPWGPGDWYFTITTTFFVVTILFLIRRIRKGGDAMSDGVRKLIASTGDVSGGLAGAKKLKFIRTPGEAMTFFKIEENAIQQALAAVNFFSDKGEIEESVKLKLEAVYQHRLEAVREAIAKDDQLKGLFETSTAADSAREAYLRKLAAMSGTTVEDEGEAGIPSVGPPSAVETAPTTGPPAGGPPGAAPDAGPPSGGPPAGGPPGGGPPAGGPPTGGPPGGAAPVGGPPGGVVPDAGPPGGAPAGGPPGGGPPGGVPSGGPPGGDVPAGGPLGGAPAAAGGKSTLQSEMLREMERLKELMGG